MSCIRPEEIQERETSEKTAEVERQELHDNASSIAAVPPHSSDISLNSEPHSQTSTDVTESSSAASSTSPASVAEEQRRHAKPRQTSSSGKVVNIQAEESLLEEPEGVPGQNEANGHPLRSETGEKRSDSQQEEGNNMADRLKIAWKGGSDFMATNEAPRLGQMSQASNNISPCGRLNDDVLREIFIHCIISDSYIHYYNQNISHLFTVGGSGPKHPIRQLPQLSVSQVCSSWRDIALLTPQLWDNIWILDLSEANLTTAREYLSRAGTQPVSIAIRDWGEEQDWPWCSQVTDFLSSYRIRSLGLLVMRKMPRFHPVLPDLPQRSVAELESLSIDSEHQEETQIDLNDTRYPKLAVVRIRGAYKISSFNNINSSLRKFDGTSLSPMTVIESWDLLSHCPSLEESRLWITRVNGSRRPVSVPQIHLQRLRILVLELLDSESERDEIPFSTFIEALSLPVLKDLRLMLKGRAVTWSATAFQSLAHRSNYFPRLRTFYLEDSNSIIDAGILLASMPRLKSIEICSRCVNVNKVIFDHLTLNGLADGSLTPRLQFLKVGRISDTESFLDMVESRMKKAQMSSNGVPALFEEIVLDDTGYHVRRRDMRQRGIPVRSYFKW
ncbi:hypothetical protein M378DRAFT_8219 [Amanita muscaria Koide BX008]|uniref:Uncharacterized protein n=1 Tax=Amanita muscaria (strain Koide BX008) TaxID=946122 RepID=A0A0C2XIF8_AMAMK|nr:hypothetical protein M378DRAFT_8219 [Amanita muscaria Koide BX008]